MAAIVYDGYEGMEQLTDTAKQVLKGGVIGAVSGLATIFVTNKLPVISNMSPVIKGVAQLALIIGASALLKDKVGEEVALGIGIGGGSVVIGSVVGELLKGHTNTMQGYGAVAPVIDTYDGYGALEPVVEPYDGLEPTIEEYDGYGMGEEFADDEVLAVEVE